MNIWHDISEDRVFPTDFLSVIEISKESNKKYELDKETGMLLLDRILLTATHYPMNYGFIPKRISLFRKERLSNRRRTVPGIQTGRADNGREKGYYPDAGYWGR